MRKFLSFLIALMLLVCPAVAEEEEDLLLEDLLTGIDEDLLADIFINTEDAVNVETGEPVESSYEADGSRLITSPARAISPSAVIPASPPTSGTPS